MNLLLGIGLFLLSHFSAGFWGYIMLKNYAIRKHGVQEKVPMKLKLEMILIYGWCLWLFALSK